MSISLTTRLKVWAITITTTALFSVALHVSAQTPPTNDNFANAIALTGTNILTTGSNDNATREPGEPTHAGNPGGKSIWWLWQAPDTGYVTISTAGSLSSVTPGYALDTVLGVYVGSTVSALTEIVSNDDGPIDVTSQVTFKAVGGTVYRVAVDGYNFGSLPADADSGNVHLSLKFSTGLPVAPAWALPSIDGTTTYSTNYAGKVVVLNFWATWCGPCVAEIPDLIALQQKYGPDGLVVIGVSVDSSPDGINPPTSLVQSFAASHQMNYPIVMTRPNGWYVENLYGGIPYIPNTFVINRQNQIEQTFVGSQSYMTFEQAVQPLLYAGLVIKTSTANRVLRVSWPATQAAFGLETKYGLAPGSWTAVTIPVQSSGSNRFVEIPIGLTNQFFRLKSQ